MSRFAGGVGAKIKDPIPEWRTKQNKEVGEVLETASGGRFVVSTKDVYGTRECKDWGSDSAFEKQYFLYGAYKLVEEGTGEEMTVRFEYKVSANEIEARWRK